MKIDPNVGLELKEHASIRYIYFSGVLVVNVTWRNRSYVGTLLDATKHEWAPARCVVDKTIKCFIWLSMRSGTLSNSDVVILGFLTLTVTWNFVLKVDDQNGREPPTGAVSQMDEKAERLQVLQPQTITNVVHPLRTKEEATRYTTIDDILMEISDHGFNTHDVGLCRVHIYRARS